MPPTETFAASPEDGIVAGATESYLLGFFFFAEDETRRGATAASSSGVNIPPVDQHPFARLPLTLIFSCVWLPQINKQETSKQLSAPSLRPLEVTSEIFSRRDRSPASRFGVCFTRACLALE